MLQRPHSGPSPAVSLHMRWEVCGTNKIGLPGFHVYPDPILPASRPCSAHPDPKDSQSKWPDCPLGGCPGLFPRSVLQRRDQEGVCSRLDPRSGQDWLFVESHGQSLYKQVRLSTGIHARCPVILVRAGEGRLRSGAWDLKELKSSNIEPVLVGSHEAIFIMVRRWIIFCH